MFNVTIGSPGKLNILKPQGCFFLLFYQLKQQLRELRNIFAIEANDDGHVFQELLIFLLKACILQQRQ